MSHRARTLALLASTLLGGVACSNLTSPPREEAIQAEPVTATGTGHAAGAEKKPEAKPTPTAEPPKPTPPKDEKPLEKKDLVVGKGPEAKAGDKIAVHYVGTLTDGKEFDSSRKRNAPFEFMLGRGNVIRGWDQGVEGMKVGGKRKLTIPPSLAYGERGSPPVIPPSATLVFEVELVEIKK